MAFRGVTLDSMTESTQPAALVKELTDAFKFFDLNGDGKLSVQEVAAVVRSLSGEGVTVAEEGDLVKLIRDVDADGDGCLNLREFIDLNTRAMDKDPEPPDNDAAALVAAFQTFDADRDGFVSAEELHNVLVGFGYSLQECRGMISGADANGDQLMSLQEFQALMIGGNSKAAAEINCMQQGAADAAAP